MEKKNKVLVKLFVPMIEEQYDIWLPLNKKVYTIIILLTKSISEMNEGYYKPDNMPMLYNRASGDSYDVNVAVKDTDIRNGTELVLI